MSRVALGMLAALLLALAVPAPAAADPCVSSTLLCTWESSTGNCGAGYGTGSTVILAASVIVVLQRSCFPTDDWHRMQVFAAGATVWWDGSWPDLDRGSSIGASSGVAGASWTLAGGCSVAVRALTQSTSAPCIMGPPPPPSGNWGRALP